MVVNLRFLDRSCYLFFQVAPHLPSQGLSGPRSRLNATQNIRAAPGIERGTSGSVARNPDHYTIEAFNLKITSKLMY
jgi:hypothetical protein